MEILIHKDGSTKVSKVCELPEAQGFAARFPVSVVTEDGAEVPLAEWLAAHAAAPQTAADAVLVELSGGTAKASKAKASKG